MILRDSRLAICTLVALAAAPAPGMAQSGAPRQAPPTTVEQPIPVPDGERGSSTPGSVVAGSAAAVAVVAILIVGGMLAWSKGW